MLDQADDDALQSFQAKYRTGGQQIIGVSARLAAEKGIEVLLKALPIILKEFPNARVLHAGPYQDIIGEEAYAARLAPLFKKFSDNYTLLGTLHGEELAAFYASLDVLCIPSLNSTESFGLVQIEAMRNGVPVAACNLPGVRQPVTMTGMGEVSAVGDHEALAKAIIDILRDRQKYVRDVELISTSFDPQQTADDYVSLFENLLHHRQGKLTAEPQVYNRLRAMRDKMAGEKSG
jgi:glycosyltransferase involved in cell wall biosynthesis